jgi:hypothetical protein
MLGSDTQKLWINNSWCWYSEVGGFQSKEKIWLDEWNSKPKLDIPDLIEFSHYYSSLTRYLSRYDKIIFAEKLRIPFVEWSEENGEERCSQ